MSSQTRIIVLKQKNLMYGAMIAVSIIAIILILMFCFRGKSHENTSDDNMFQYTAGVYSSTVVLNGNPVEIRVTMDDNLIHHIDAANISDSIETMFPVFDTCFNEITEQVIQNNSTQNITYPAENKYTSIVLLDAIDHAISKSIQAE